jgi:hypothetical protein
MSHRARALEVRVTMDVQGRTVAAADVKDKSVSQALAQMGRDIGTKLATVTCPEHQKGPTDVRIHVGRGGNADIRYESCCSKLRDVIGKALG